MHPAAADAADPRGMLPDRRLLAPNALRHGAAERPDAPLLRHADGRTRSYRDSHDTAARWAAGLRAAGIAPGEHVAYLLTDPIDSALTWLATGLAGNVTVPVNSAYFGRMLAHVLADSGAAALAVTAEFLPRITEIADELPMLRLVVVHGDRELPQTVGKAAVVRAESLGAAAESLPPREAEAFHTAAVLYTSGTTGPSKGVVVPWAAMHGYWCWVPDDTLTTGETLYCPMPLFHISGLGALHYTLSRGGTFATRDRFSGTAFWSDTRTFGAVAAGLVGPMTAVLYDRPEQADDADNPLRGIVLGPMIPQTADFERRFGVRVATSYGMTEVPPLIVTGWDHGPWRTCGRVAPGYPWAEARLVDADDIPVPPGTVGELVIRTGAPWALNAGYHNLPEATAHAWRNGWFHTGDAFRQDADGRFFFADRLKDAIRRRGENISSFEVESFVLADEDVAECAAYAVPAAHGDDEVMVALVPPPGRTPDPAALAARLAARMPAYMVPRYLDIVPELPRNTTSLRVLKHVLRDRGVTAGTWDRLAAPEAAE